MGLLGDILKMAVYSGVEAALEAKGRQVITEARDLGHITHVIDIIMNQVSSSKYSLHDIYDIIGSIGYSPYDEKFVSAIFPSLFSCGKDIDNEIDEIRAYEDDRETASNEIAGLLFRKLYEANSYSPHGIAIMYIMLQYKEGREHFSNLISSIEEYARELHDENIGEWHICYNITFDKFHKEITNYKS